eukprot:TRINITY_DN115032_c0_g1_i1.p1 TRINITY_DN115032_c0_g1~~TRINITY_DN115032_c0_g1_i1.p1  ORF type:complete len:197 (-),score=39.42 TRINITY_DN115032_c0_g1_i1:337-927(-)
MACELPIPALAERPSVMAGVCVLCQASVALWIWSVWSWRMQLKTAFRPGQAADLLGEFRTYGYNDTFMKTIGLVKLSCASILGAGIVFDDFELTIQAASLVFIALMLGAIVSHAKVCDPLTRYVAAAVMGALGTTVFVVYHFGCAFDVERSQEEDRFYRIIESAAMPLYRNLIGGFVIGGCVFMWLSSYVRGDYDI